MALDGNRTWTGGLAAALLAASVSGAFAQDGERAVTTSTRLVLLAGQTSSSVKVPLPVCPGARFLVRELVVAPEVITGRTAADIVNRMIAEVGTALKEPTIRAAWERQGSDVPNLSGDAFGKFVSSEVERWGKVVKAAGVKLEGG